MKVKPKILFIIALLLVLSASCFSLKAYAQNGITGTIFNDARRPVAEIDVELLDQYERFLTSVKTRSSGLYFFNNLRAGVYYIQVRTSGTGFAEQKARVSLGEANRTVQTSSGTRTVGSDIQQINIFLQLDPRYRSNSPLSNEVIFVQDIPREAETAFKKGVTLLESNKVDLAISEFIKATDIFPDYYSALVNLGKAYIETKQFEKAEKAFDKAVKINEKGFVGFFGLAVAQNSLNKKEEAESNLHKSIELNPNRVADYLLLGIIQRDLQKYPDAEKSFLKADTISESKEPDVHWNLALLYYHNLKRFKDAANQLELYLRVATDVSDDKKKQIKKLISELKNKPQ